MIGPIRQELLSGIRTSESFARLRDHLQPYADEELETGDFERAAEPRISQMDDAIERSDASQANGASRQPASP